MRKTMKIAIPSGESKIDTAVCVFFGRAPYFMLHNTETEETTFIADAVSEAQGGTVAFGYSRYEAHFEYC